MAKPTRAQVMDAARAHLGADATGGSAVFSNAIFQPHFESAYRTLFRIMNSVQNPYVETAAFYDVPAYTSVVQPSAAGISDLGEVIDIWDRGNVSSVSVSNVTASGTTVTVTTSSAHGRTIGQPVILYGVVGISGVAGIWTVASTPSSTSLTFNGASTTGSFTSGGTLSYSPDAFPQFPLTRTGYIDATADARGGSLSFWSFNGDVFRFIPSTEIRQIRVLYSASGSAPTQDSDVIGIDDSVDALSYRTAGLAALSRGMRDKANELNSIALGPSFAKDGLIGGMYLELLQSGVRAMQGERYRRPPFRDRRTLSGMYTF